MKIPKITIPLIDALMKIDIQLRRGKTIQKVAITSMSILTTVEERRLEWHSQIKNILESIDENDVLVDDFHYLTPSISSGSSILNDRVHSFRFHMDKDVQNLASIKHRIQLMIEIKQKEITSGLNKKKSLTNPEKVWVWDNTSRICYICNKKVKTFLEAYFDHTKDYTKKSKITPIDSGITHLMCNQLKGKKSLKQIKKLLAHLDALL